MVVEKSENKHRVEAKEASALRESRLPVDCEDQLLLFEQRFTELAWSELGSSYWSLLASSLSIISGSLGLNLQAGCALYSLNVEGDPVTQASFGMVLAYFYTFCLTLALSSLDKLGIELSAAFGEKDFGRLKVVMCQGVFSIAIISCGVTFPLMYFSGGVLRWMGIAEANVAICERTLRQLMGVYLIELCSDLARTFCISQGFDRMFAVGGLANMLAGIGLTYFFVVVCGLSIEGWVLARFVFEAVNLAIALCVLTQTHPDSRSLRLPSGCLEGFGSFFVESVSFSLGSYCELISYQMALYFVALSHDDNQITAFTAVYNVAGAVYCLGISFLSICRSRVNFLLGAGRPQAAKNYFEFFYLSALATGAVAGAAIFCLRDRLAGWLADSNPEMKELFKVLMAVYCLGMPNDTSYGTSIVGMKSVNKIRVVLKLSFVIIIGAEALLLTILHLRGAQSPHFLATTLSLFYVQNFICFYIIKQTDWSQLKMPVRSDEKMLELLEPGSPRNNF